MRAYASYAGSGDIYPSQAALATRGRVGKRTVALVQDWLIENGWLVVTAPAISKVRGPTVRLTIPEAQMAAQEPSTEPPPMQQPNPTVRKEEPIMEHRKLRRVSELREADVVDERAGSSGRDNGATLPVTTETTAYVEAAHRRRAPRHAPRTVRQQREEDRRNGLVKPGPAWISVAQQIMEDPDATERDHAWARPILEELATYEATMAQVPSFD